MSGNRVFHTRTALAGGMRELFRQLEVTLEDGTQQVVYLDTNYNSVFAPMHEDYLDDAIAVDLGLDQIRVHVLSPVDLAVSKTVALARQVESGQHDLP